VFVCVPLEWLDRVCRHEVLDESVLTIADHVDHRAVVADVILDVGADSRFRATPAAWYRREGLRLPEVQLAIQQEWALVPDFPSASADWSSDCLNALHGKVSRLILAKCSPAGLPAPRAEWMSAGTWAAISSAREARKRFFAEARKARTLSLRALWHGWLFATNTCCARSLRLQGGCLRTEEDAWSGYDRSAKDTMWRKAFAQREVEFFGHRTRTMVKTDKDEAAS
jgi:hypothetical protein